MGEGEAKVKAEGARRICEGELGKEHPVVQTVRLELLRLQRADGNTQDATENDPQSGPETQVVRVRKGSQAADQRPKVAGGLHPSAEEQPSGVQRLRPKRTPVRPIGGAAVRVT